MLIAPSPLPGRIHFTPHEFRRIICTHCGTEVDVPIFCGRRFCPICGRARMARTRSRVSFILAHACRRDGFQLKMISLTIRNQTFIEDGCRILVKSFRRLRATRAWKSRVRGGLFVIEVTGIPGHWHTHLHILVDCRFFPVRLLSRCWASVAPGKIVDCRRIPYMRAISYVTKYLTKASVDLNIIDNVENGLRGLRLFQPFGLWHGISRSWKRSPAVCRACDHSSWDLLDIFYTRLRSKRYDIPIRSP